MELRDLHPCDNCNGQLGGSFQVIRMSMAILNKDQLMQSLGGIQMLGGSLQIAEAMGMTGGEITVMGEKDSSLYINIILCMKCYLHPIDLAEIAIKVLDKIIKEDDNEQNG
jgi:hypothetical protein